MTAILLLITIGAGVASFYSQVLALSLAALPLIFIGAMYLNTFSPVKIKGLNVPDEAKSFFEKYSYYFAYRVAYEHWQAISFLVIAVSILNIAFFDYSKSNQLWVPMAWVLFCVLSVVFYFRFVPRNIKKGPVKKFYELILEEMRQIYKNTLLSNLNSASEKLNDAIQSSRLDGDDFRALSKFSERLRMRDGYLDRESELPVEKDGMRNVFQKNKALLESTGFNSDFYFDCLETFVPDNKYAQYEKNIGRIMNLLCTQITMHYEESSLVFTAKEQAMHLDISMKILDQDEEALCGRVLNISSP